MAHLRLNETETNPNPHINFITALPMPDARGSEEARRLLRALAAQVRPVMKAHGFTINSFEEYEYNSVFAGRNWNNGETVEIVLRRSNGSYCPTSWLMSTVCHEVIPLKHMNHGPAFQALWAQLRREVRQLQDRGYYGDGYWSSGTRLVDSARISGDGIEAGDFPEYMCGGAQTRTRPNAQRRRRGVSQRHKDTTPSLHTGRQTAKRRKAGSRVTSKYAFAGVGNSLVEEAQSSKRKRAVSNRAREERALAAEKRLNALVRSKDASQSNHSAASDDSDSDSEIEFVQETDAERRQALLDSKKSNPTETDLSLGKGLLWRDFESEFNFTSPRSTFTSGHGHSKPASFNQDRTSNHSLVSSPTIPSRESTRKPITRNIVQDEIKYRKKEALGMVPVKDDHRMLGKAPKTYVSRTNTPMPEPAKNTRKSNFSSTNGWSCLVCTLENQLEHLACAACATLKGEDTYIIR
ncbi:DNA damage response protein wss1 [Leucoagaricus sp. SymC.cos]|nr:DNA damage response protein wss1 [Leucoagaricus sp. SymC.cos]